MTAPHLITPLDWSIEALARAAANGADLREAAAARVESARFRVCAERIAELQTAAERLQAEHDEMRIELQSIVDALRRDRNSLQWHAARLNQLQIAQLRMRDPERTMVCDILANGTLLDPAGSRYAAPQPAAELQRLTTERDALAAKLDAIERAVKGSAA